LHNTVRLREDYSFRGKMEEFSQISNRKRRHVVPKTGKKKKHRRRVFRLIGKTSKVVIAGT